MFDSLSQVKEFSEELQFGFVPPDDVPHAVARLEEDGADSLWTGGHISAPTASQEAITGLARLASESRRALVGTSVLLLPLYSPAIVAKQVAEIDRLAEGRTVLGVGVGGEHAAEFGAVQVSLRERGARANEAIPLLRRLWSGDFVDHEGRFFPMEQVRIIPPPAQPGGPLVPVAGRKEPAIRRAAIVGDGWMPYMYTPDQYRRSVEQIRAIAAANDRDLGGFGWFLWSTVHIRDDADQARSEAADYLQQATGQPMGAFIDKVALVGAVDDVVARLTQFIDAGARHLIFATLPGDGFQTVATLFGQVIPALRAARPSSSITAG